VEDALWLRLHSALYALQYEGWSSADPENLERKKQLEILAPSLPGGGYIFMPQQLGAWTPRRRCAHRLADYRKIIEKMGDLKIPKEIY